MARSTSKHKPGNRTWGRLRTDRMPLEGRASLFPFLLLLFYLFFEYGRPQVIFSFLSYLHLPAITIILLGISILFSGNVRIYDKQTVFFLLLLGLMVIHGPIAVNNYWALMIFIAMSMNLIVLLSLVHFVDDPGKYDRLVKFWLGIHIFLAVVGILKKGTGIGGFLEDENDFCMTLNMVIPFSFFLAVSAKKGKKLWFVLITCLFLFVIILTESRGGFVGLAATSLYCWFRSKRKAIMALFVALLALFAVLVAPSKYWNEVRSITEEGTSAGTGEERMYTWRIGWHMFLDNPVIGVGQGNFPYIFKKYEVEAGFGEEGFHGRSVAGRAAHSIYFTMLPELGMVGTFLFIAMVISNIKDLNRIKKVSLKEMEKEKDGAGNFYNLAIALEGSLISFLVSGAFISILYYPNFWVLMGFILSLKNIVVGRCNPVPDLHPYKHGQKPVARQAGPANR